MTIQDARNLLVTLAPKSPGHLITAADWNSLVSVLAEYGAALDGLPERLAAAEVALNALDARVGELELLPARVQQLEDETAPLRDNYRLSVRTTAENVLVGQVAEIVFSATALDGSPLAAPMPWLDVVTTWGRLRAAPGFAVRDNAEENAISVQFNNAGEVRVQLRAQHVKGLTATQEAAFGTAMRATVGTTGQTVIQLLSASASPQDAPAQQAFKVMHASYDGSAAVRTYADHYLGQATSGAYSAGSFEHLLPRGEWEDYRATVMAFAKPDASPTTPDPTRGIATVQVTFREWLPSWGHDYIHFGEQQVLQWSNLYTQNLARADVVPFLMNELDRRSQGARLGHVRNVLALGEAAERINPGNDLAQAQNKALIKGAAQMQMATGGGDAQTAVSYGQQAQASQQAGQVARAAQATAAAAQVTKGVVEDLDRRMKLTEQAGKEISAGLRNIGDGVNKINVAEVADLGGRLNRINLSLTELAGKIPR